MLSSNPDSPIKSELMKFKDIFYLQKKDRQALLTLLAIMIVCVSLTFLIQEKQNDAPVTSQLDSTNSNQEKDASSAKIHHASKSHPLYSKEEGMVHELFPFDPNTASAEDFERLGLESWQARSIIRFREKGGIFSRPSDFARVYGITKRTYEVLLPFIQIADDYKPAADFYGKEGYGRSGRRNTPYNNNREERYRRYAQDNTSPSEGKAEGKSEAKVYSYPHKLRANEHIEINGADTTLLMKIPGIGSYYASRIVRYRERLGGFASAQQLEEIDGLPESSIAYIKIDEQQIRKMNLNKLTLNQLKKHPYLNFYQAKEICDYRRLKGPLHSIEDLKLLKDFPPDEIERLKPYICF